MTFTKRFIARWAGRLFIRRPQRKRLGHARRTATLQTLQDEGLGKRSEMMGRFCASH